MENMTRYSLVFKQAAIQPDDAERYIDALKPKTLDIIAKIGFDRRLIKPILKAASKDVELNPEVEFDEAVNNILNNKNRMLAFMQKYCL